MDIKLGILNLTAKQIEQSSSLKTETLRGFGFGSDGSAVAVSTIELTEKEIDALKASLVALPDEYPFSYYSNSFSYTVLEGRLNQEFTGAKAIALAPYLGAIQGFVTWKNWTGMRDFASGLVIIGVMSAEDLVTFKSIVKEQGIDLDNLPAD